MKKQLSSSSNSLKISTKSPHENMVIHNRNSSKNQRSNRCKMLTANQQHQRQLDRQEMQSLLAKLKQLVPGIPKHRHCSKLEIIQHVIDYIFDLQTALEQHPIASTLAASALATADFITITTNSANIQNHSMRTSLSPDSHQQQQQNQTSPILTTATISCDRYLSMTTTTTVSHGHAMANITTIPQQLPSSHHHQSYQHQNQSNLPQRIPGSNRQPLASIVL
ncbi:uncharacterized protein LOC113798436 [Dermatophagoides pteronyssinus]|uniref:uncharacterized protein LOC113798436 n=1 Tax=Dermatophagoides pteronyssinus TaxID=6956 RepID=UPI003F6765A4